MKIETITDNLGRMGFHFESENTPEDRELMQRLFKTLGMVWHFEDQKVHPENGDAELLSFTLTQ